jgi:hypothetical protein
MRRLVHRLKGLRCCAPPPRVTGVVAQTGGGSGEVFVGWDPLPPSARVAHYRVHRRVQTGVWRPLASVTEAATDPALPGKVAFLDFEGNFPGLSDFGPSGERTYVVSAVSRSGVEGPWSATVTGTPP